VTKFHTAKLNGFVYAGSANPAPPDPYSIDLRNFKNLLSIQSLRNQVGADVVTAIMAPSAAIFEPCGVAYVQTFPTCSSLLPEAGCDAGADFEAFAYNITVQECVLWTDAYTHELGHVMGANHARNELSTAWRTDVINNGYPEAFGYSNLSFTSIMSVARTTILSRRLNFSNPDVTVDSNVVSAWPKNKDLRQKPGLS